MAERCGKSIRSIKLLGHLLGRDLEITLHHACDLLLGSSPIARDRLLDTHRHILGDRDITSQGSRHRYPLGSPQLQHALDILAKEGSFDGQFVWMKLVDQAPHTLEDLLQSEVVIFVLIQSDDSESQQTSLLPLDLDESIAHDDGTGVDPHDDTFAHSQFFR